MSNKKVTEAQVFGTRDCNLRCGYCELVKDVPFDLSEELRHHRKITCLFWFDCIIPFRMK